MNKCYFTGRTTKDIELRYTQDNKPVAKFSFAVESGYGDNKKTNFFNISAFGKTAETLEKYAQKGTKLLLECQANHNKYTDKNGNQVNSIDFIVSSFEFCESKQTVETAQPSAYTRPQPSPSNLADGFMSIPDGIDEELPFQ